VGATLTHLVGRRAIATQVGLTLMAAALLVGCKGPSQPAHPVLNLDPVAAPVDAPLSIQLKGLEPSQQVTLRAHTSDQAGATWSSSATYKADDGGVVDLSRRKPVAGSYDTTDTMGLLWSLAPDGGSTAGFFVPPVSGEEVVTLTAEVGGRQVAIRTLTRLVKSPDVSSQVEQLAEAGFRGEYFARSGTSRHEALMVFGGSEGGLSTTILASLLAGRGYPTLALAYFGLPGLPDVLENIPLEYFVRALEWLRERPEVDPSHVLVLGISRGSEAALLLGANFPELVQGVIACVPSSVANPGLDPTVGLASAAWTLGGEPVPTVTVAEYGDPKPAGDPAAIIPVERIRGPVLLVAGQADRLWPSSAYARAIIARLDDAHDGFLHRDLDYPAAGHAVGALVPNLPESDTVVTSRYGLLNLGGTRAADAAAKADAWPKLLAFLSLAGQTGS
jgi:dienelactone hydrolase